MEVSIKIDTARLKMEALVEKENQPLQFPVVVEER